MEQVAAVGEALCRAWRLRSLNLTDCRLGSDGVARLCGLLLRSAADLTSLDLSENLLERSGATALASLVEGDAHSLRFLGLRGTGLTDEVLDLISAGGLERSKSLISIDLSYNLISDVSVQPLEALLLLKPALYRLDLQFNLLTVRGVSRLDLQFNLLTVRGVSRLQHATHERSAPRSLHRARAGRTLAQLPPSVWCWTEARRGRHCAAPWGWTHFTQSPSSLAPRWGARSSCPSTSCCVRRR